MNVTLNNQINTLSEGSLPFVLYFLPGESEPTFLAGDLKDFDPLQAGGLSMEGFVFAPYKESLDHPSFFISADHFAQGEEAILSLLKDIALPPSQVVKNRHSKAPEITQEEFVNMVSTAVDTIKESHTLTKVVLSRIQGVDLPQSFDAPALLSHMREAMPLAFCYFAYIPGQGVWMGATPERLLEVEGRSAQTNALAGTLRSGTSDTWSQKEIDEQRIVSDYISDCLRRVGVSDYELSGPDEMASGAVRHLRSVFTFDLEEKIPMLAVVNALHPTPAICGMPRQEADDFIAKHENHSREYYAGYLGPIGLNEASHLFVNLRCMKLVEDRGLLYVGAGITAGSEPLKEWEETGVKALTLLNVIRNYKI
ncbi:MAG: isochorismate synthase [Bacteroidales bacterium]|jgi:isochorismate synthase|nr:isochorismate synthase [Bacteroidales bacterium]